MEESSVWSSQTQLTGNTMSKSLAVLHTRMELCDHTACMSAYTLPTVQGDNVLAYISEAQALFVLSSSHDTQRLRSSPYLD
jgi:hypothetical protein